MWILSVLICGAIAVVAVYLTDATGYTQALMIGVAAGLSVPLEYILKRVFRK